jgi:AcrR family transcriptional regulator
LSTRDRILEAAERLFGEQGAGATSLRAVTAAAGVNVAAIHYHFGSKEALLAAVLERHVAPINRERLERLDALAGDARVEEILEALLAPALAGSHADPELRRVAAILQSEPLETVRALVDEVFGEVTERFVAALARALPDLSRSELRLRFHFVIGVMLHVLSDRIEIDGPRLSERALLRRMVAFLAAGLRA